MSEQTVARQRAERDKLIARLLEERREARQRAFDVAKDSALGDAIDSALHDATAITMEKPPANRNSDASRAHHPVNLDHKPAQRENAPHIASVVQRTHNHDTDLEHLGCAPVAWSIPIRQGEHGSDIHGRTEDTGRHVSTGSPPSDSPRGISLEESVAWSIQISGDNSHAAKNAAKRIERLTARREKELADRSRSRHVMSSNQPPKQRSSVPKPSRSVAVSGKARQSESNYTSLVKRPSTAPAQRPAQRPYHVHPTSKADIETAASLSSCGNKPESLRSAQLRSTPKHRKKVDISHDIAREKESKISPPKDVSIRLYENSLDIYSKRESARRERENSELEKCTFSPHILNRSRKSKSSAAAPMIRKGAVQMKSKGGSSFGERLYEQASERILAREQTRAEAAAQAERQFTFSPNINPTSAAMVAESSTSDSRPLHKRAQDELRRRTEKRAELARKIQTEDLFTPRIDPTSAAIAEAAHAATAAHRGEELSYQRATSRLAAEADALAERRLLREAQKIEEEARVCTFKPRLNDISERIASNAVADGNVFERLRNWEIEAQQRHDARLAEIEEAESHLFVPKISEATDILLSARPARLSETMEARTERLANLDAASREGRQRAAEESYYGQFKFTPEINEISSKMARSKTTEELNSDDRKRAVHEAAIAAARREEDRHCTFKPKVSMRSERLAEASSRASLRELGAEELSIRLAEERLERDRRREEARRKSEILELRGCTFKPDVTSGPKPARMPAPEVRGLDTFYGRLEGARKLEEERRERESKVFVLQPRPRSQPFTVPEPFNLSHTNS